MYLAFNDIDFDKLKSNLKPVDFSEFDGHQVNYTKGLLIKTGDFFKSFLFDYDLYIFNQSNLTVYGCAWYTDKEIGLYVDKSMAFSEVLKTLTHEISHLVDFIYTIRSLGEDEELRAALSEALMGLIFPHYISVSKANGDMVEYMRNSQYTITIDDSFYYASNKKGETFRLDRRLKEVDKTSLSTVGKEAKYFNPEPVLSRILDDRSVKMTPLPYLVASPSLYYLCQSFSKETLLSIGVCTSKVEDILHTIDECPRDTILVVSPECFEPFGLATDIVCFNERFEDIDCVLNEDLIPKNPSGFRRRDTFENDVVIFKSILTPTILKSSSKDFNICVDFSKPISSLISEDQRNALSYSARDTLLNSDPTILTKDAKKFLAHLSNGHSQYDLASIFVKDLVEYLCIFNELHVPVRHRVASGMPNLNIVKDLLLFASCASNIPQRRQSSGHQIFITMSPGIGKTYLHENDSRVFSLEDGIDDLLVGTDYEGTKYKELLKEDATQDELNKLILDRISLLDAEFILSSKWWEDLGHSSDAFVVHDEDAVTHDSLSKRGRPDLAVFSEDTLMKWREDSINYCIKNTIPFIELSTDEYIDADHLVSWLC